MMTSNAILLRVLTHLQTMTLVSKSKSLVMTSLGYIQKQNNSGLVNLEGTPNHVDVEEDSQRFIGLTKADQRTLIKRKPLQPENPKVIKVSLIGAPNAGKSTLSNKILGWRFAAVSSKVHTTRKKTLGVLTKEDTQIIFLDTPGLVHPGRQKRHKFEKTLVTDPHSALFETDLIAVVVDVSNVWHRVALDQEVLKALYLHPEKKSILILNKVDILKYKDELLKVTKVLSDGVVAGQKSWKKQRTKKKLDIMSIYKKMGYEISKEDLENQNSAKQSHEVDVDNDYDSYNFETNSRKENVMNEETEKSDKKLNVDEIEDWNLYKKRLNKISRIVEDKVGWPNFDSVFMISAKDGTGVEELKDYFFDNAQDGPWQYHGALITDQNPVDLAKSCVWEKLMDHLPGEIPYQIHIDLVMWEVDEDNLLKVIFNLKCKNKRHLNHCLGKEGQIIKKIAMESKQELMNTFRRDLSLRLDVKLTA